MNQLQRQVSRGFFPQQARILAAQGSELSRLGFAKAGFIAAVCAAVALEAVRLGAVERPLVLTASVSDRDPVVASVGSDVIRVSDAVAQAAFIGGEETLTDDMPTLLTSGAVDTAADNLALAHAARDAGLADAIEVRAAVALAERQILAEAYLDWITRDAVTEEAIRRRYAEEKDFLAQNSVMKIAQIVVATEEEAKALRARLPRADFAALAKSRSIDEDTAQNGGRVGELRAGDLPENVATALAGLGIGGVSEPLETRAGWHLIKLEARRAMHLPPLAARRDAIIADLKAEAIAAALAGAKESAPVRVRDLAELQSRNPDAGAGVVALLRAN